MKQRAWKYRPCGDNPGEYRHSLSPSRFAASTE
jgi:hypothetical protein